MKDKLDRRSNPMRTLGPRYTPWNHVVPFCVLTFDEVTAALVSSEWKFASTMPQWPHS